MGHESKNIKPLNQLLQGEYMAVEAFNIFISKTKDENTKEQLQQIQHQHRKNINDLAVYIQNLGGQPHENLGLKGKMANMKVNMEIDSDADILCIIKKAIDGETKGVNMAEKVLRGELDVESRNFAGEILEQDRKSIDQLMTLQPAKF